MLPESSILKWQVFSWQINFCGNFSNVIPVNGQTVTSILGIVVDIHCKTVIFIK